MKWEFSLLFPHIWTDGSSQPCRYSCCFFLNSICLWHQHKWFNGGNRLLRLHNKTQQKDDRIFCFTSPMQFSFLRSQTAFSSIKTSYDVLIRPINMEMSCENAADRSLPYFTTAARAPSEIHFVDHGYRGLSYCWDWILSSEIIWCTRVYQHVKFVEKLCASDFVCWHTTYQHLHTNNQTNHSDFES